MTKNEREKLAAIVAQMAYSHGSDKQSIGAAQEILETFPSIAEEVEHQRFCVALENLAYFINSALHKKAGFDISGTDNTAFTNVYANLVDIVSDYAFSLQVRDRAAHVISLESQVKEASVRIYPDQEVWAAVSGIISTQEWLDSVEGYFQPESKEYNYLVAKGF